MVGHGTVNKLLSLLLLALLLVACGDKDESDTSQTLSSIVVTTESGSVTVDQNRVILSLRDGFVRLGTAKSVYVKAKDYQAEGEPIVWEGPATNYSSFELPYWIAYPEFTHAGPWLLELEIETVDGEKVAATLGVNVQEQPFGVIPGQPAPASESRTGSTPEELAKITTADPPNPAFYEQTVAQALQNGKPSLIVFSTPALCSSDACGPMMKTFEALWEQYSNQMNFIHVEVYETFEAPLQYVATMQEWGLINEPWVYLVDGNGIVNARFDTVIAIEEITPRINDLLE